MNAKTLQEAMPGLPLARAEVLVDGCNKAMLKGKIVTRDRAAAFLAQIGHESVSLLYKEEIGPQSYWSGYGGGASYHGRTFIQVTHDYNYKSFGEWLGEGDRFVRSPQLLVRDHYAWLGPVWYWTKTREEFSHIHNLNKYADDGDFLGLTRAINGGYNGLEDRQRRHRICRGLGKDILPEPEKLEYTKNQRKLVNTLERTSDRLLSAVARDREKVEDANENRAKLLRDRANRLRDDAHDIGKQLRRKR